MPDLISWHHQLSFLEWTLFHPNIALAPFPTHPISGSKGRLGCTPPLRTNIFIFYSISILYVLRKFWINRMSMPLSRRVGNYTPSPPPAESWIRHCILHCVLHSVPHPLPTHPPACPLVSIPRSIPIQIEMLFCHLSRDPSWILPISLQELLGYNWWKCWHVQYSNYNCFLLRKCRTNRCGAQGVYVSVIDNNVNK